MKDIVIKVEEGKLLVELSKEIYEKQAVLASAYKFTDKFRKVRRSFFRYDSRRNEWKFVSMKSTRHLSNRVQALHQSSPYLLSHSDCLLY